MPETMAALTGTLVVQLIRAQGIRGDEMLGLGKADPYAIITCGAQTHKSLTAQDQGSDPVWNQTFKFKITGNSPMDLCIELYNKNTFIDNKLGIISISLQEVFSKKKTTAVLYDVIRPNTSKYQGKIEVQLTFEPKERMSTSKTHPLSKEEKPMSTGEMQTTSRRSATASDQSSSENYNTAVENTNFSFPVLSQPQMGYPAAQVASPFVSAPVTGYLAVYSTTYQSDFSIPGPSNSDHPEKNLSSYLAATPATRQSLPSNNHIGFHKHPRYNSQAGPIQFEQRRQPGKNSHHKKNVKSSTKNQEPRNQPKANGGAKDGRRHSKRRTALAATVVVAEASALVLVQLAQVFVLATAVAVSGSC